MSALSLKLPDSLNEETIVLAKKEGILNNQFVFHL
jgi:hypothetical protein